METSAVVPADHHLDHLIVSLGSMTAPADVVAQGSFKVFHRGVPVTPAAGDFVFAGPMGASEVGASSLASA